MEASSSPDAKRARISRSVDPKDEGSNSNSGSPALADGEGAAAPPAARSMTARSHGAAPEGEYDPLFDDPVVGEELEGLMGDPPSASQEEEVEKLREHTISDPGSVRDYIATR